MHCESGTKKTHLCYCWQLETTPFFLQFTFHSLTWILRKYACVGGFLCSVSCKESTCNAGNMGSIPGSGRSPEETNDNSLQYSCLENSMDKGGWWAIDHGIAKIGHS